MDSQFDIVVLATLTARHVRLQWRYDEAHEPAESDHGAGEHEGEQIGLVRVEHDAHDGRSDGRGDALEDEQNAERVRQLLESEQVDEQYRCQRDIAA